MGPLTGAGREDEAGHLRRVANELGGANTRSLVSLRARLTDIESEIRLAAAASLGSLGDRNAIALLRRLLEGERPEHWELAVHGLRQSRDRTGWLCLESVALDRLPTLDNGSPEPLHAFRLLVMGRTKTMDRLFRAIDGHSRTISSSAALSFSYVAARSVPAGPSRVMAMRLGIDRGVISRPSTPVQISSATGFPVETVRQLEAEAWESVQRPRQFREIWHNYEVNGDRFRSSN